MKCENAIIDINNINNENQHEIIYENLESFHNFIKEQKYIN